ncbi:glycosyltransferase family 4 protein [Streptomyces piniterrae]|uniref:glycosyltransferase family 4 protein n=1 Tax=Streptomyces piniterrae TaxID=2571125 RepID=UPI001FEC0515|nr:glycosyltransferase family 4 protein [Streptomyces piniterrae]
MTWPGIAAPGERVVHFVLPGDVDDPTAPSGGNTYDLRVCRDLPAAGWRVRRYAAHGGWPRPDATARAELALFLGGLPDGATVLLDGLVACAVPEVLETHAAGRLRTAVLVHLPLGDETGLAPDAAAELDARERRTLHAVRAVVATSKWAARRLITHHGLAPDRVHVARPGADAAPLAPGTDGTGLLCVAAVTPRKGQDRLVTALAAVADLPWSCVCVGGLGRDGEYVAQLRKKIIGFGMDERIHLAGPRAGAELDASYAAADLLVLTSYAETYGMVVTEALARGIPVLATAVDGVPEAVGLAPDGSVPGLLVPSDDPAALVGALRGWLGEPELRYELRKAARERRATLERWEMTSQSLARVLERLRHEPRGAG